MGNKRDPGSVSLSEAVQHEHFLDLAPLRADAVDRASGYDDLDAVILVQVENKIAIAIAEQGLAPAAVQLLNDRKEGLLGGLAKAVTGKARERGRGRQRDVGGSM